MLFRRFFQKGEPIRTHNVHVYEKGHGEIERQVNFRNWMQTHAEERESYAKLKQDLALKFPNDLLSYCIGKESFVRGIDAKAGPYGTSLVQALSPNEWETFLRICSQHNVRKFFLDINSDGTCKSYENNFHIVMYHNGEIVCIAHVEADPKRIPNIKWILSDKENRKAKYENAMEDILKRWAYERVKFPDSSIRKGSL